MTDKEVIKAFACCNLIGFGACEDCPCKQDGECIIRTKEFNLEEEVLNVFNRQQAEIDRLKELLNGWKAEAHKVADEKDEFYCNAVERVKTAKAEAIKEFAERLKENFTEQFCGQKYDLIHGWIDNLVKEMVGDE